MFSLQPPRHISTLPDKGGGRIFTQVEAGIEWTFCFALTDGHSAVLFAGIEDFSHFYRPRQGTSAFSLTRDRYGKPDNCHKKEPQAVFRAWGS